MLLLMNNAEKLLPPLVCLRFFKLCGWSPILRHCASSSRAVVQKTVKTEEEERRRRTLRILCIDFLHPQHLQKSYPLPQFRSEMSLWLRRKPVGISTPMELSMVSRLPHEKCKKYKIFLMPPGVSSVCYQ